MGGIFSPLLWPQYPGNEYIFLFSFSFPAIDIEKHFKRKDFDGLGGGGVNIHSRRRDRIKAMESPIERS